MNKLGVVLGVAAVVTLSGCLDPNYKKPGSRNQAQVTPAPVEQQPTAVVVTPDVTPVTSTRDIEITTVEQKCTCAPGTKHAAPCACGSVDCQCVVEKPVAVTPVVVPAAAEAATTTYIVQRGDYLAKISKKYNIKLDALRAANPQLKDDVVKVGQKLNLPGKIEVGEQTVPAGAFAATPKKEYKPYAGATKEYVVKAGDTLGGIAYGNGINIRQLKELNGLTGDGIRVGQKLQIPAEKVKAAAAAPAAVATKAAAEVKAVAKKVEKKVEEVAPATAAETTVVAPVESAAPAVEAPAAPAAADEGVTHVVQEGEDITGLSIRFSLSPAEIRELNNLGPTDELKPGQVLKLPADTQL